VFEKDVQGQCNYTKLTLDFWTRSAIENNGVSTNNNYNNNNNSGIHEEMDPTKPTLVLLIKNDEEGNLYYFEYKRYSVIPLNWREPWEVLDFINQFCHEI